MVESQNWSDPDSGYEQTRGKLEEFGKFVNHMMNLIMIFHWMRCISVLKFKVTGMVYSGDAGPSKKFRDHTQLAHKDIKAGLDFD